MLLLKHMRGWSYAVLTREVRANLLYREFTRIGGTTVVDDKTMGRLARQMGPERFAEIHQRVVEIAQEKKVVTGRKMRVDTTVVENQHPLSDRQQSAGDGVRVLTRTMKKITEIAGEAGRRLRDRKRSVGRRLREIGRASRSRGRQANRIRQAGQDPGSGDPDHHQLRSVREAAQRLRSAGARHRGASAATGPRAAHGGRRCGLLFSPQ